jgi:hypothetical protein
VYVQVSLHSDLPLLYPPAQLALAALLLNQARRHFQQQLDAGQVEPAVDLTQTYALSFSFNTHSFAPVL